MAFQDDSGHIEIRQKQQKFYAVLQIGNQIVYISECLHTPAAASMAAEAANQRYENNRSAALLL